MNFRHMFKIGTKNYAFENSDMFIEIQAFQETILRFGQMFSEFLSVILSANIRPRSTSFLEIFEGLRAAEV